MNGFNSLGFRTKVWIGMVLPTLVYIIFSLTGALDQWTLVRNLKGPIKDVALQIQIGRLQHDMYIERGLSLTEVAGMSEAERLKTLRKPREAVDLQMATAREAILDQDQEKAADATKEAIVSLDRAKVQLQHIRQQVDTSSLTFVETAHKFSSLIDQLSTHRRPDQLVALPGKIIVSLRTAALLSQYENLLGLERAWLVRRAMNSNLGPKEQDFGVSLLANKRQLRQQILMETPEVYRHQLLAMEQRPELQQATRLGNTIRALAPSQKLESSRAEVFSTLSIPVDSVHSLVNNLNFKVKHDLASTYQASKNSAYLQLSLSLAGVLFVFIMARLIFAPFVAALTTLHDATTRASKGDLEVRTPARSNDEMGLLQSNFNTMIQTLQEAATHNKHQSHLKDHVAQASTLLFSQETITAASSEAISFLAKALDIPQGAVFVRRTAEEEFWDLQGSYAYQNRKRVNSSFQTGEGLIGQCAVERQPISVRDLPEDYFSISSALGHVQPNTVFVIPAIHQEDIVAIVELGLLRSLNDYELQLVEEVVRILGMVILSIEEKARISDLLEETQQLSAETKLQAQELQQTNSLLHNSNKELERKSQLIEAKNERLEQVAADLDRRAEELQVASQHKSDFLARMSHELRTPLNSLILLSQLLLEDEDPPLSSDQKESVEIIHKNGKDLVSLIDDILDLSKVEAGKLEMDLELVDPRPLIKEISTLFRQTGKQQGLDYEAIVDPAVPASISTDAFRLGQILKNLLSNAFKFTEKGEVLLRVYLPEAQEKNSLTLAEPDDDWIAFSVKDTGPGIEPDLLNQLFEPFDQLEKGMARRHGGTGLGLTISRNLAHLLGGELLCRSVQGEGCTFTLYLPLIPRSSQQATEPRNIHVSPAAPTFEAPISPVPQKPTILVIDGAEDFCEKIRRIGEGEGFQIAVAQTGAEGLEKALAIKPAGILLGLVLPDMPGQEVLDKIRSHRDLANIPIQTLCNREEDILGTGNFVAALQKPVSLEQLQEAFLAISTHNKAEPILLVEDDEATVDVLKKVVEREGWEMIHVSTVQAARETITQCKFAAIILDLCLPDGDGLELIESWNGISPIPPVIVFTGDSFDRERYLQVREHVDHVILKEEYAPSLFRAAFSILLKQPTADSDRASERNGAARFESLENRSVLIADDDLRASFALSKLLGSRGAMVTVTDSGSSAIEKVKGDEEFDLILVDLMMPDGNGFDLIASIRKESSYKEVPIVAMSAGTLPEHKAKALASGADDFITKPIEVDQLLASFSARLKPTRLSPHG